MSVLHDVDHEIFSLIKKEEEREQNTIDLIASENYASGAILEAVGSILTNKYAEGYPAKRYYAGCQIIDQIELLAQERCKQLFGAQHSNVQPHSGSQANMTAYFAVLKPGDTILGMSLAEGGHLTHGHPVNFSGKIFKSVQYTVNRKTELLDYDEIEHLAKLHKPKLIIAGASAYSRIIDFERFSVIANNIGALLMADIAHIAGLIAARLHPSPVPYADLVTSTTHKTLRGPRGGFVMCKEEYAQKVDKAIMPGLQGGPLMNVIAAKAVAFKLALQSDFVLYQQQILLNAQAMASFFKELGYRIVTDGTDNHLFVLDLRSQNLNGKIAQEILEKIGIIVSKSCIPFDPEQPWITSGIRIGTPAITTRGMKEEAARHIVHLIHEAFIHKTQEQKLLDIAQQVRVLCNNYSLHSDLSSVLSFA